MTTAIAISAALVLATVLLHYEVLQLVGSWRRGRSLSGRIELLILIVGSLLAHLASIGLYAAAFYWMAQNPALGALDGASTGAIADFYYFSITCYTTLGFGDIFATGPMRIVAAIEGLNGLVLITWSASFAYTCTSRLWQSD